MPPFNNNGCCGCRVNAVSCDQFRKAANLSRTLAGNKIVDHSDEVETSPDGVAPTTSLFSSFEI